MTRTEEAGRGRGARERSGSRDLLLLCTAARVKNAFKPPPAEKLDTFGHIQSRGGEPNQPAELRGTGRGRGCDAFLLLNWQNPAESS